MKDKFTLEEMERGDLIEVVLDSTTLRKLIKKLWLELRVIRDSEIEYSHVPIEGMIFIRVTAQKKAAKSLFNGDKIRVGMSINVVGSGGFCEKNQVGISDYETDGNIEF